MRTIINYRFTIFSLVLALSFFLVEVVFDFDLMENILRLLAKYEKYEVDELLLAGFIFVVGVVVDVTKNRVRKDFEFKLQMQRLHILQSTIRTMQDLINNLVVALQYFKINAEDSKSMDSESVELIDSLIKSTTDKVNALANIENPEEKEIYSGVTIIDCEGKKRKTIAE